MRRVVVVVLLVGLLVAASGVSVLTALRGGSSEPGPVETPTTPPTTEPGSTDPPARGLARYYSQQVEWEACQDDFECASITVPLDYADPRGETIDLALLKVPAAEPGRRVGSLVVNPGGPGAPGTEYAAQAGLVFRDPLLDRFDIVGFDPRGTGSSSPVDCLSDAQLDDYIAADPDPDTATERREYIDVVDDFGRGCLEKSGDLAAHVSTIEAARDLDVLRSALGESALTYFGASYGTQLGATYADLFPDRVGRFVLDGAVDLSIDARESSLQMAGGFETALRAYVENCIETTSSCFLGDTVDEGLARIRSFLDQVDATPLSTSTDRDLEIGNAFYGIVAPLYFREYWFVLSTALKSGFDGDGSTLLELSDLYTARVADGYADNRAEAIYAVSCLDDPSAIDPSEVPAAITEFEEVSPTFGSVFAWGLTGCAGIRVATSEEPRTVTAAGAAPIVVVGTTRDPATPMIGAVHLAEQLESGVLIRRDGDGHTGYNSGNDCVDEAVEAYLVDGTVPEDGLSC